MCVAFCKPTANKCTNARLKMATKVPLYVSTSAKLPNVKSLSLPLLASDTCGPLVGSLSVPRKEPSSGRFVVTGPVIWNSLPTETLSLDIRSTSKGQLVWLTDSASGDYLRRAQRIHSLGPFHGAIAVPSVMRCRCCRRRCRGHRCAGGVRQ